MSTAPAPMPNFADARKLDAKTLRLQIESAQGGRLAGALTPVPRQIREMVPSGIAALDQMLGGGVPLGAITELAGPASSGRTGVALSILSSAMREGSMCAWVDASDALDPESAAANGVQLDQLLWVRCGVHEGGTTVKTGASAVHMADSARPSTGMQTHARAGQHPRDEERGLDRAVGELLGSPVVSQRRDRSIGTPGAPNRPLDGSNAPARAGARSAFRPVQREEQVSSDRQPKRRQAAAIPAQQPAHFQKHAPARPIEKNQGTMSRRAKSSQATGSPWTRLDQALRATDLLLQAGGFQVLVLDLGSIAPEHALRIPLATWFRFRAAAEASRTVLLAIVPVSCAKSSAGLVVCFESLTAQCWSVQSMQSVQDQPVHSFQRDFHEQAGVLQFPGGHVVERAAAIHEKHAAATGNLIESVRYQARMVRQRFESAGEMNNKAGRRPSQATWQLRAFPLREADTA